MTEDKYHGKTFPLSSGDIAYDTAACCRQGIRVVHILRAEKQRLGHWIIYFKHESGHTGSGIWGQTLFEDRGDALLDIIDKIEKYRKRLDNRQREAVREYRKLFNESWLERQREAVQEHLASQKPGSIEKGYVEFWEAMYGSVGDGG